MFHLQNDIPFTFECKSGELLFGQMQCIAEGMKNKGHDGMKGPTPRPMDGGTIRQNDFQYRLAARVGQWKVSRVYVASREPSDTHEPWHIGYILHHIDVSPIEYLDRACKVGISNGNGHDDRGIVYINRYDWGWHHGERWDINIALGPDRSLTAPQVRELLMGRLIVLDAKNVQTFFNTAKTSHLERKCYTFFESQDQQQPYGIQLDPAGNHPEYELGWLGFSGSKHPLFPDSDEVVAIVYDPAYNGLELSDDQMLLVEDAVVITGADLRAPAQADEDSDDSEFVDDGEWTSSSEDVEETTEEGGDDDPNTLADELSALQLPDMLPPPTVSNVSHFYAHTILITGSTLGLISSVTASNRPVTNFKIKSNELIEATLPPEMVGPVSITVQNGDGNPSNAVEYVHPVIPTITSLTPNQGLKWGGETIVISGYHFDKTTDVLFDDRPALSFEIVSDRELKVRVPACFPVWYGAEVTLKSAYPPQPQNPPNYQRIVTQCHDLKYQTQMRLEPYPPPPNDDYEPAIQTWKRVLEESPLNWGAREELWDVYKRAKRYGDAVELWKEMVPLVSDATSTSEKITVLGNLAEALVDNGEYREAIRIWEKAIDEYGADEQGVFEGMAGAYESLGDKAQAKKVRAEAERLWAGDMQY